jgi:hypothetical protein
VPPATLPAGKIRSAYAVAETDVIRCGACAPMVDPSLNGAGARSRLRQLRISENMVKWSGEACWIGAIPAADIAGCLR